MKRTLLGLLVGVLAALPFAANADHIQEPTAPVLALDLHLENYATDVPVNCDGGHPDFPKIRVAMYTTVAGAPSEHFTAKLKVWREVIVPKTGESTWVKFPGFEPSWDHQNVPPHASLTKFDASRLTNLNHMNLYPGAKIKVEGYIEGDESGTVLEDECIFFAP